MPTPPTPAEQARLRLVADRLYAAWLAAIRHRDAAPSLHEAIAGQVQGWIGVDPRPLTLAQVANLIYAIPAGKLDEAQAKLREYTRDALERYRSGTYRETGERVTGDALADVSRALGAASGGILGGLWDAIGSLKWPLIIGGAALAAWKLGLLDKLLGGKRD